MNRTSKKVAVIAGVGEGLGQAIARRFAPDYHVVMFARDLEKLQGYAAQLREAGSEATGMKVDLRVEREIVEALATIEQEIGPIEVAVYNAGAQHRKPLLEISGDAFEKVWRLGAFGAFVFAREAVRHMEPRGKGTIIFTGATSSLRGGANFGAFAAAKFATRAVIQSIAREFGPKGIHAATVIIDGAVNMPAIHRLFPDLAKSMPPDGMLSTDEVAETYYQIHRQHRSAWTLEADLRPYSEKF
ncbi:short chain dehydrogenase/reductase family oxidoreductase [Caballeronia cordobensis]|uniref:Short chain dehydrogenase/reductase family oxidoreductase n=1 Tax=Caballeronia cordobensis TaxID=1353886 RepID=A0A158IVD2_CABCO|nr:SDR family NAD(P)-dependent oxidoreductase [Caballeronia cordobensis]SAL60536.1 short chain dehydrogenase/reductase family oxidoreductase [Caballeronia cordobensis]